MSQPSPLIATQHQAVALRSAGDLAGARRILTEAITAARPAYGEDHADVLAGAHLLARLHREADDLAAARRVLEEAYAAGERSRGEADPLLLAISFDLAGVAEELGNRYEARRNYARVATVGPATLGPGHPAVRTARWHVGRLDAPTTGPDSSAQSANPDRSGRQATGSVPRRARPAVPVPQIAPPFCEDQDARSGAPAYPKVAEPEKGGRKRAVIPAAAGAAVLAAAIGVGVAVLNHHGGPRPAPTPTGAAPVTTGSPPGDLRLRDGTSSITISWSDPTGGGVPFIIAAGRAGQRLGALATVDPGRTSYTVNGLNAKVDYCFAVLAVYSTDAFATSGQVCTNRERTAPPR